MAASLQKAVIWGASGHALVIADILRLQGVFAIAGYLDSSDPRRAGEDFGGATVLGGEDQLETLKAAGVDHVALGIGDCAARLKVAQLARKYGYSLVTAIHPNAVVAGDAQIGAGTVICAGAVINPAATLGEAVIVNTCASIDHECRLGEGVHVSPGANLAGRVTVGAATAIGIGSAVRDGINIGRHSIIGAGSVVVKDIPDHVTAYGVPAVVVSERTLVEK